MNTGMNDATVPKPGHVLTLLTLGRGENASAVLTDVFVTSRDSSGLSGVKVCGPVHFEEKTVRHCDEVVIPLVHRIAHSLRIPSQAYDVCATNLGAASMQDRGAAVRGFSADAALFIACLSATLETPALPGVAVTGHIASLHGDVRMVRSLPAKLQAAATSPIVETVLFPDPSADDSVAALTPEEKSDIDEAVRQGRDRFHMMPVCDVAELISGAFSEPELILASMRRGYFGISDPSGVSTPGIAVLAADLPRRFWCCMEEAIHGRDRESVHALLRARVAYQLEVKTYPAGFGMKLYRLLSSVPPGLRHSRVHFPLLESLNVFSMVQLASPDDLDDLRHFLDAVAGDRFPQSTPATTDALGAPAVPTANQHLAALLDAIAPETLYRTVSAVIEAARGSFTLETVIARDDQECLDIVTAFHIHLLRHSGTAVHPLDPDALAADAGDLLEQAFARQGGANAAFREARAGTRGRLRYVLDVLTEYFRADAEEKHRNLAFKKMLKMLEYDEQVALVKGFMDYLGPQLPEEVRSSRPEQFVKHAEVLLRAYAQVSGRFRQLVRAL